MNASPSSFGDDDDADPEANESAVNAEAHADEAPETNEKTRDLTAWDQPLSVAGTETPRVLPDDEESPAERLVAEGIEAAERERRLAADERDDNG